MMCVCVERGEMGYICISHRYVSILFFSFVSLVVSLVFFMAAFYRFVYVCLCVYVCIYVSYCVFFWSFSHITLLSRFVFFFRILEGGGGGKLVYACMHVGR